MKTHVEVVTELKALREELAAERIARLSAPSAAHRNLREDYERLRERVAALEEAK